MNCYDFRRKNKVEGCVSAMRGYLVSKFECAATISMIFFIYLTCAQGTKDSFNIQNKFKFKLFIMSMNLG